MEYTSTITQKGQMTLPVDYRTRNGLKSGRVRVITRGRSMTIVQDDWQADLARLQAKVQQHLRKHNIKPLTDEELDRAINDAGAAEAQARYRRSLL